MIAVDTSALMAILKEEEHHENCARCLADTPRPLISAATVAEAMIVALGRGLVTEMAGLLDGIAFEVVKVDAACARRVADIYARWGKGVHPAGLNFGDCFAYEVAVSHGCPVLYIGNDFAKTDIQSALPRT